MASDHTLEDTPGQSHEDLLRAAVAAIERGGKPFNFTAFGGHDEPTRICVALVMVPADDHEAFMDAWVEASLLLATAHGIDNLKLSTVLHS